MTKKLLLSKITDAQDKIKVPKAQKNGHGGYMYRSCEDILEAIKPVLKELSLTLIISDEIVNIADRFYVKAIVTVFYEDEKLSVSAYAREVLDRKGMDLAQITGASSSYARKYALCGLFALDDTRDADATNTHANNNIVKKELSALAKFTNLLDYYKISEQSKLINLFNKSSVEDQRKLYGAVQKAGKEKDIGMIHDLIKNVA